MGWRLSLNMALAPKLHLGARLRAQLHCAQRGDCGRVEKEAAVEHSRALKSLNEWIDIVRLAKWASPVEMKKVPSRA